MYRVLIVEDETIVRDGLRSYLEEMADFKLVACLPGANAAPDFCQGQEVDLILMDICTQGGQSGIEAAAKIKAQRPGIKVILLTSMLDIDFLARAREAGADSFCYKGVNQDELREIMERTLSGESIYPDSLPNVPVGTAMSCEFTESELKVLRLLVKGLSDAEISEALHLSISTVRWHISAMFAKTGYTNRVQLACEVINKHLIVPGY